MASIIGHVADWKALRRSGLFDNPPCAFTELALDALWSSYWGCAAHNSCPPRARPPWLQLTEEEQRRAAEEDQLLQCKPVKTLVQQPLFGAALGSAAAASSSSSSSSSSSAASAPENLDVCVVCAKEGELFCCDFCPRSFCLGCKGLQAPPAEDPWRCGECEEPIPAAAQAAHRALQRSSARDEGEDEEEDEDEDEEESVCSNLIDDEELGEAELRYFARTFREARAQAAPIALGLAGLLGQAPPAANTFQSRTLQSLKAVLEEKDEAFAAATAACAELFKGEPAAGLSGALPSSAAADAAGGAAPSPPPPPPLTPDTFAVMLSLCRSGVTLEASKAQALACWKPRSVEEATQLLVLAHGMGESGGAAGTHRELTSLADEWFQAHGVPQPSRGEVQRLWEQGQEAGGGEELGGEGEGEGEEEVEEEEEEEEEEGEGGGGMVEEEGLMGEGRGAGAAQGAAPAPAPAALAFLHDFTSSLTRGLPIAALYHSLPEAEKGVFRAACGLVAAAPPPGGHKKRKREEEEP